MLPEAFTMTEGVIQQTGILFDRQNHDRWLSATGDFLWQAGERRLDDRAELVLGILKRPHARLPFDRLRHSV